MVEGCHFQAFWVDSKPFKSNFFIFLEPGKKSDFFRKILEKSAIFLQFFYFRFFLPKIVFNPTKNRFFIKKSAEKNDFLVLGYNIPQEKHMASSKFTLFKSYIKFVLIQNQEDFSKVLEVKFLIGTIPIYHQSKPLQIYQYKGVGLDSSLT